MRSVDIRSEEQIISEAYIEENKDHVRFVNDLNRWFFLERNIWVEKSENEAYGHLYEYIKDNCRLNCNLPSKHVLQKLHFKVKINREMWLRSEDFDVDMYCVNTPNRVTHLKDKHRWVEYYTKTTPTLIGNGTCPLWQQVLSTITQGDKDLEHYLQKAAGYSLSGDTSEQCFFLLYGSGRNGKSTFLNTLRYVMGSYAYQANSELLTKTASSGPQPELASLKGSRLVLVSELERRSKLNIGLIKQITGGDAITARHLYSPLFSFLPQCKLWITTNDKPTMHDMGDALWRRVRLIPFNANIPKEGSDPNIEIKLRSESMGIFNWLVEGFHMWQEEGLGDSKAIITATQNYRNESSSVKLYIEDMCCLVPDSKIPTKALYVSYKQWCSETGYEPMDYLEFGKQLSSLGIEKHRTSDKILRKGIRINAIAGLEEQIT